MQVGIQICCPVHGNCITAKGPILAQLYRIQSYVSGLRFSRGLGVAPSTMVNFLCKSEGLAPSPSNSGGKEKLSGEAQPNFSKQSRSLADNCFIQRSVISHAHLALRHARETSLVSHLLHPFLCTTTYKHNSLSLSLV